MVELHTWRSSKTGKQLVAEVCGHCFYGTGRPDGCRSCGARQDRHMTSLLAQAGPHEINASDVPALLEAINAQARRRRR
jgi:hypothetical protein